MKVNITENFDILNFKISKKRNFEPSKDIKEFILFVDRELKRSQELKKEFIEGKNIPLYEITIQAQKAKISLELLTKLRDEALKAYNSIINMRL